MTTLRLPTPAAAPRRARSLLDHAVIASLLATGGVALVTFAIQVGALPLTGTLA